MEIFDEECKKINTLDSITAYAKFLGVSNDVVSPSEDFIKKGKPFVAPFPTEGPFRRTGVADRFGGGHVPLKPVRQRL